MPFTGYDNPTHGDVGFPDDIASADQSQYYALSPGGRFPGDIWAYLEGVAGQDRAADRTSGDANPNYDLPSWLEHIPGSLGNILARLVRGHEYNVRNSPDGTVSNPLRGGDVYQGWSGPGAAYGPEGGPLHGLLDQGNDHLGDYDYGQSPSPSPDGPAQQGRHGGGHNNFGPLNWQPYSGGAGAASQFVDWQPIHPFTVDASPTRFVGGAGGTQRPSAAAPTTPPFIPSGGGHGGHGNGAGGHGRGAGGGAGTGNGGGGNRPASTPAPNDGNLSPAMLDVLRQLFGNVSGAGNAGNAGNAGSSTRSYRPRPGGFRQFALDTGRGSGERGYDTNYLERGTPGWTRDATTGTLNTAGMPLATPFARGWGETDDDYITRLSDSGVDLESIMGMMDGWGTGDVVRGDNGYVFANDPSVPQGGTQQIRAGFAPYNGYNGGSGGSGNSAGSAGGGAGAGGDDRGAGALTSGWTPNQLWY